MGSMADDDARNPWERYSWILGGVWVVFMIFPIASAIEDGDATTPARTAAVVILVVYAVVYLATYMLMVRSDDWAVAQRRGPVGMAVMVVLMVVAAMLIGPGALGAGSFLVSLAMFSGPLWRAVALAACTLVVLSFAIGVVLAIVPNGFAEYGVLFMPPAIVFFSVAAVRFIMAAGERHRIVQEQAVLVAERERVARDVHDVLGHSLTIITVKAELAERLVDADLERARAEIAQIRSLSREALAEVRATVSGLRVARLGDELVAAEGALRAAGIEAEVPQSPDEVDPRFRIVAAWVLREAVTNVVRHSKATRCVVTLHGEGIAIEDDGVGISAQAAESGLRGIRERVVAAGAALEVGPARALAPLVGRDGQAPPGAGTRMEVRWP